MPADLVPSAEYRRQVQQSIAKPRRSFRLGSALAASAAISFTICGSTTFLYSWLSQPDSRLLFFVQIFAGNVVLQYLVGANFLLVIIPIAFHTSHSDSLERVSFLE